MPKGHKQITWTPTNDARLLLTILSVSNIHPNLEAVAAAFGAGVNAQAIGNRLSKLRKKAVDEGFVIKAGGGATVKGKNGVGAAQGTGPDDDDTPPPITRPKPHPKQKILTGRVSKARPQPVKKSSAGTKAVAEKGNSASKDENEGESGIHDQEQEQEEEELDGGVKVEV